MLLALAYSILRWNSIKNKPERWIVLFLFTTVMLEIPAFYLKSIESKIIVFNNIIILITNSILMYWFYEYTRKKNVLIVSIVVILISFIVNSFFSSFLYKIYHFPNFIISILLIINTIIYFRTLLLRNEVLTYYKEPAFWISLGILVYQLILASIFFLLSKKLIAANINMYVSVLGVISFILYSSFTYGISLNKK